MQQADYRHLDWDSHTFGFNVADIACRKWTADQFDVLLGSLKEHRYRLAYWVLNADDADNNELAAMHEGFLAAQNATYTVLFDRLLKNDVFINYVCASKSYIDPKPNQELECLAIQSGAHSRYHNDPLFPRELFEKLYLLWITRSVTRQIAREVLVLEDQGKILGMITLGDKEGKGNIGLLAVDPEARRKHIAQTLIRDAQFWFINHGFKIGQVATQKTNIAACSLYESCGYRLEKIQNIYHFWL
jgi:dTDP-4-amino-4,6-dideoxy-D-galactose acyltransferase